MSLGFGEVELQLGQAGGEGGGLVLGQVERGRLVEELLEADRLLPVERRLDVLVLGDADGVDDDEPGLGLGVRGDGLEVGRGHGAGAAALHLLEVLRGADVAHEEHALQRLHVGAGGDHVDGDRDPQGRAGAERLELLLGVAGGVGDLGGEVVALAEHLADLGDDLLGVVVVLGEDQRLRHSRCGRGRSR